MYVFFSSIDGGMKECPAWNREATTISGDESIVEKGGVKWPWIVLCLFNYLNIRRP
jgi:hypothetical protein